MTRSAPLHCRLDVPPERLARLIGAWREPAILEGGAWSVYTARPRLTIEARGRDWTIRRPGADESGRDDFTQSLGRLLDEFRLADPRDRPPHPAPPFRGGLVGFLGYDLAPQLECLPRKAPPDSRLPDLRFGLYDTVVTVDPLDGVASLWADDLIGDGPDRTRRRFERWRADLGDKPAAITRTEILSPFFSNLTRNEYMAVVRSALDYIAAGDVFQVNLSQRFTARGRIAPLDLYLRLRAASPAPFAAFLRWEDCAVVSASPEWFYQSRGDAIATRPIKGTRPRGRTPEEDRRLVDELRASPKDRAELTMIVDLERNDLGRVCRFGTVRVVDPMSVETYAQVHHLVATVEGRLRLDAGPIDVVRAVFPGGSITGAPKIRAMQIIDELEPTRRSLYTGAIGYFGLGGCSMFNIAIRTMLVEGDRVSYQVGGGIVADSDPEAEYEETLHKGRGMRAVLEGAGS